MIQFVAYYRVSGDRQGQSGLDLDAQRRAVICLIDGRGRLAAEFTEVESGKRSDRTQLAAALECCRRSKAILVIANFNRLARNIAFITRLLESEVEFVAEDNPHANKLMLHLLATLAKHERDQISARTKAALAAAKARGAKLGSPNPAAAAALGRAILAAKSEGVRSMALPLIRQLRAEGLTLRGISAVLTTQGIPPLRGRAWHAETVRKLLAEVPAEAQPSAEKVRMGQ